MFSLKKKLNQRRIMEEFTRIRGVKYIAIISDNTKQIRRFKEKGRQFIHRNGRKNPLFASFSIGRSPFESP